jgi:DNA processing protein
MRPARRLELDQPDYPQALRALPQPPPALYVQGRIELLGRPGIAVVGTRAYSTYGRDATVSFVVGLVRAGYTIVSGLARGIDGIAHQTALDVGGDTVGVLGTGIDVPYPPEHEGLIRTIAGHGCLVSEFPPGTGPRKFHFPQRNRIIAGLSRGVLVVEAPEKSGATITAVCALEEGKEVFAVPGPIHNPTSVGTNRLIQQGAALVTSAADILRILQSRTGEPLPEPLAAGLDVDELDKRLKQELEPGASELAQRIWAALEAGESELENLGAAVGAAPAALATALLELELAGLVEKLPGPRYARARVSRVAGEPST